MQKLFNTTPIDASKFLAKRAPKPNPANPKTPKNSAPKKRLKTPKSAEPNFSRDLESGQFRYLNEYLYKTPSAESKAYFTQNSGDFTIYHKGYNNQIATWPKRPLDVILGYIEKNRGKFEGGILADLGCGLGELAEKFLGENGKLDLFKKIYSYDLKSTRPWIEEVDIADLGFGDGSIQTAVFCLSLMGPNYLDFLKEATRVLARGGRLIISEVISRFLSIKIFLGMVKALGFKIIHYENMESYFNFMVFVKMDEGSEIQGEEAVLKELMGLQLKDYKDQEVLRGFRDLGLKEISNELLRPCIYKKR